MASKEAPAFRHGGYVTSWQEKLDSWGGIFFLLCVGGGLFAIALFVGTVML